MRRRWAQVIFTGSAICFILNYFNHKDLLFSALNSYIYVLSITLVFSEKPITKRVEVFLLILLSLMPLYYFVPSKLGVSVYIIAGILLILISNKLKAVKFPFVFIGLLCILIGALISNQVFLDPFTPNNERLIWNNTESNRLIEVHSEEAVFVFYRLRPILFNKAIYINIFFRKIAEILTLRNLQDILLLANLYPLSYGLVVMFKKKMVQLDKVILIGLSLVLAATGINKYPDKFNSLYIATPFISYIIFKGFEHVNKRVYLALLIFSLFLLNASTL